MRETPHIEADAVGLASLQSGDLDRVAAYRHARSCADCALALRNAEKLLEDLGALPAEKPPSAAALRAIIRPVVGNLSLRAVPSAVIAGALACVWTILVLTARDHLAGGPAWAASAGLLGFAGVCVLLARRVGGAATALTLAGSALMVALAWGETGAITSNGLACLLTEVGAAMIPFIILVCVLARRPTLDLTTPLVTVAASGALAGQAALHLTCPGRSAGLHLLAFHFGGVALTIAAAAIAALALRARAAP